MFNTINRIYKMSPKYYNLKTLEKLVWKFKNKHFLMKMI